MVKAYLDVIMSILPVHPIRNTRQRYLMNSRIHFKMRSHVSETEYGPTMTVRYFHLNTYQESKYIKTLKYVYLCLTQNQLITLVFGLFVALKRAVRLMLARVQDIFFPKKSMKNMY